MGKEKNRYASELEIENRKEEESGLLEGRKKNISAGEINVRMK